MCTNVVKKNKQTLQKVFDFIAANWQKEITQLAFKKELVEGIDNRFVLQQLYGKQKAKKKLPFLFNHLNILYPLKVSVEQSTSETVAAWKAQLVAGQKLLDITGGFGVDSYFFSQQMQQVTYCEQQTALTEIAQHNFQVLKADNIQVINKDAVAFLKNTDSHFDWIYLDPARRDDVGNRKIGLADYAPNVLTIKELLFQKGKKVLLKTSPMLDIQQAIQQLGKVVQVYVVAVKNEVKELLFEMESGIDSTTSPTIQCVNLETADFPFVTPRRSNKITYAFPKTYLYEPNAAILKAGLFNEIGEDFKLEKLHPNTHLYTSEVIVPNFPGRTFSIQAVVPYQKKAILPHLTMKKVNISTRNFPYSVAEMKKKLGIKDGGAQYLFGATLLDENLKVILCEKLNEELVYR